MNALEKAKLNSEKFLDILEQREQEQERKKDMHWDMVRTMDEEFSIDMDKFLTAYNNSEEFRKKAQPYMQISCLEKDTENKTTNILVNYNILLMVAYDLCLNKNIYKDIDALYEKFSDVFDTVRAENADLLDNWISTLVPFSCLSMYKKLIVIMASIANNWRDKTAENDIVKYHKKGYRVKDIDVLYFWYKMHPDKESTEIENETFYNISEGYVKLLIKSNKKLYREIKNTDEFFMSNHVADIMYQLCNNKKLNGNANIMQSIGKLAVALTICNMMDVEVTGGDYVSLSGEIFLYPLAFLINKNIGIDFSKTSKKKIDVSNREEKEKLQMILCGMELDSNMALFAKEKQNINRFIIGSQGISAKDIQDIRSIYYQMEDETAPYIEFFSNAVYMLLLIRTLAQYEKGYDELIEQSEEQKRQIHRSERLSAAAKQTIADFSQKEKILEEENKKLKEQLVEMEKRLNSTAAELEREKQEKQQEKKELVALRNYVYENGQDTYKELENELTLEEMEEDLRQRNVAIIGGHQNWNNKMKAIFPDWTYIAAEQKVVSESMLSKKELVLVFEEHCKHSLYFKVISSLGQDTKLGYIGKSVNIDLCVKKIYDLAHEQ